jgi:hypothetical protein
MQNIKKKKRLTNFAVGLLLVFLIGGAFAFLAGVLDVVGDVHVAAPQDLYVVWNDTDFTDGNGDTVWGTFTDNDVWDEPNRLVASPWWGGRWVAPPNNGDNNNGDNNNNEPRISPLFNPTAPGWHRHEVVDARDRTNQRIYWDIYFYEAGTMTLGAVMMNRAQMPALVTGVTASWVEIAENPAVGGTPWTAADFGLVIDPYGDLVNFVANLAAFEDGNFWELVPIEIRWDGTLPEGFVVDTSATANPQPPYVPEGANLTGVPGDELESNLYLGLAGRLVIEFDYVPAP